MLNCVAEDVPLYRPLVYEWIFNQQSIDMTLSKYSIFQNNSLFVSEVEDSDLGSYQCVVHVQDIPEILAFSNAVPVVLTC